MMKKILLVLLTIIFIGVIFTLLIGYGNRKIELTDENIDAVSSQIQIIADAFYVSKDGDDDNIGSLESPWLTIQKAADTLKEGDTVFIKEGTYHERIKLKNSGSSTGFITFSNHPGETVIIDGDGIDWGFNWDCLFSLESQDYIIINGLKIINSVWAGIGDESDVDGSEHIFIQNCHTYNTRASGIAFYNCKDITVDSNSVELANMAYLEDIGCQEAISISNVNKFVVKNNTVKNITNNIQGLGGEGIDAKEGASDGIIFGNTIYDVAKIGIYVDSYSKAEDNIEVYNNKISDCGSGITVASEKGGLLSNINIHNNTIINCQVGFTIAGWGHIGYSTPMDNIIFNQNKLSKITKKGIFLNNPEAKNVMITNNILDGVASSIPIYMDGGDITETFIKGNTLNRVVRGHPTGTDYVLTTH